MALLHHSPSDIVATLIVQLGLGTDGGDWPVWVDLEQDKPDEAITVQNTLGIYHGRTWPDSKGNEHYGFQVRVRGKISPEAWDKIKSIVEDFDRVKNETVSIGTYQYLVATLKRTGGVMPLGRDIASSFRTVFVVNFTIVVNPI